MRPNLMPNLEPTSKLIMKVLQDSKIVAYRNKKLNIEKFSKDLHKVKSKKKIQAKNLAKISQYETDEPTKKTIDRRFQRKTVSHDDFDDDNLNIEIEIDQLSFDSMSDYEIYSKPK